MSLFHPRSASISRCHPRRRSFRHKGRRKNPIQYRLCPPENLAGLPLLRSGFRGFFHCFFCCFFGCGLRCLNRGSCRFDHSRYRTRRDGTAARSFVCGTGCKYRQQRQTSRQHCGRPFFFALFFKLTPPFLLSFRNRLNSTGAETESAPDDMMSCFNSII